MIPLGNSCRPIRVSCFGPSYRLIRDVTGGIRASPRASERDSGANLSESVEFLKGGACRHLRRIPHRPCEGGDLGLVVRSYDEDVMSLRGGECNIPRV